MSPPTSFERTGVVQSSEEVEERVLQAIRSRSLVELDLVTGESIRFRVRTTDHREQDSLIIGVTDEHQTVNIHLLRSGEVYMVSP